MSWSTPSSLSTGTLVTAATWNQDVKDNAIALRAGAVALASQAIGDLPYASSTTQFARVAAVAAGQVLASAGTGTVPAYSATPALTSVDMGGTTVYGSRAITVDTGGVLNIVLASAAGDDFTVDTDKMVIEGDTGRVSIGGAPDTYAAVTLRTAFTSSGDSSVARGLDTDRMTVTGVAGDTTHICGAFFGAALTVQDVSETVTNVAEVMIEEPYITKGAAATITNATTLQVVGVPSEGTNNYAFWVDSTGVSRFDGNVGIGIAAPPDGTLHVQTATAGSVTADSGADDLVVENSTHVGMTFLSPSGDYQQTIAFGDVGDPDSGRIVYDHDSNMLALWTEGSERVTIDSSGDVGIGTTTPNYLSSVKALTLQGSTQPRFEIVGTRTGDDVIGEVTFINRVSTTNNTLGIIKSHRTGANTSGALTFTTYNSGSPVVALTLSPAGALSKASGSFKIDHPHPDMNDFNLVHSFVEGPRADLIYRSTATLSAGTATIDLDTVAGMRAGTWALLCRDPSVYTSNETGWKHVRGSVSGSTLTIDCEDDDCTDTISFLVIAERQDQHMIDTDWTDSEGRVITEPVKPPPDPEAPPEDE